MDFILYLTVKIRCFHKNKLFTPRITGKMLGDIPHAIAMYTDYTGDDSYVKNEGMDVLVGTARLDRKSTRLNSSH